MRQCTDCRRKPWACLRAAVTDAGIIIGVSVALALTVEKTTISREGLITFAAIFVPVGFALRAFDVEYSDQLPRVALFHLATKIFNVMAL
jgi:hypothetical protein